MLPVEIWEDIIRTHLHTKDYLSLSTTTPFLRTIAQRALFEEVYIFRNLEEEESHPDNRGFALFARTLANRPDLGGLVGSLHINSESDADDDEEKLDRFSEHPLLSNLSLFSRLHRLRLAGFLIDADFSSAVRSHPRLNTIEFSFCSIDHTPSRRPVMETLSEGLLSKVDIEDPAGPTGANAWATVVPKNLQSLTIDFQVDTLYIDVILSSIATLGGNNALTTLCIRSASTLPSSLVPFLVASSQIRRLSFDIWSLQPTDALRSLRSLPPDAIPLLEDFTGPVELAEVFVRGRPVHTVKLMFDIDSPADVLSPLHLSTASVMRLEFISIYSTEDDPSAFLQHAPLSTRYFSWGDRRSYKVCTLIINTFFHSDSFLVPRTE